MTTYRMRYRPPSYSTLPSDMGWSFVELPHNTIRRDLPVGRWPYGTFITERPLTKAELTDYEIEELP